MLNHLMDPDDVSNFVSWACILYYCKCCRGRQVLGMIWLVWIRLPVCRLILGVIVICIYVYWRSSVNPQNDAAPLLRKNWRSSPPPQKLTQLPCSAKIDAAPFLRKNWRSSPAPQNRGAGTAFLTYWHQFPLFILHALLWWIRSVHQRDHPVIEYMGWSNSCGSEPILLSVIWVFLPTVCSRIQMADPWARPNPISSPCSLKVFGSIRQMDPPAQHILKQGCPNQRIRP